MTAHEINVLINLILCLLGIVATFFPIYWLRTHNGDYKEGFRLILPALAQSGIGCFLFGMFYAFRLSGLMSDVELQGLARPVLIVFLLLPFTLTMSLHNWAQED